MRAKFFMVLVVLISFLSTTTLFAKKKFVPQGIPVVKTAKKSKKKTVKKVVKSKKKSAKKTKKVSKAKKKPLKIKKTHKKVVKKHKKILKQHKKVVKIHKKPLQKHKKIVKTHKKVVKSSKKVKKTKKIKKKIVKTVPKKKKVLKKKKVQKRVVKKQSAKVKKQSKKVQKKKTAKKVVLPAKKQVVKKEIKKKTLQKQSSEKGVSKFDFSGLVFDAKDKKIIEFAKIKTEAFPYPARSNKKGEFKYPLKLSKGKHSIEVSAPGYKTYKGNFEIPGNIDKYSVAIYLAKSKDALESYVVLPPKPLVTAGIKGAKNAVAKKEEPKPVKPKKKIVKKEETKIVVKQQPKTQKPKKIYKETKVSGDPQILPFIANTAPITAYGTGTFVAGERSSRTGFYFNGHRIFSAFHLFSGKSVLPEELIQSVSVKPAGYSTKYFDSTGGIVDISLRSPQAKKVSGNFDASLLGISLFAEGSLLEKENNGFAIKVNRNLQDLYGKMFVDDSYATVYPVSYDFFLYYFYNISSNNKLNFFFLGDIDSVKYSSKNQTNDTLRAGRILPLNFNTYQIGGDWTFSKNSISSKLSGDLSLLYFDYSSTSSSFKNVVTEGTLKEDFQWKIDKLQTLKAGLIFKAGMFSVDSTDILLPVDGENGFVNQAEESSNLDNIKYIHPSLYLSYNMKFNKLQVEPGVVYYLDIHNKDYLYQSVDPRLITSYEISQKTTIKVSGGLYSQRPLWDRVVDSLGTEELEPEHSIHGDLAFEIKPLEDIKLNANAFFRYGYNLIRRDAKTVTEYNNNGIGYSTGAGFDVNYKLGKKLNLSFAYSFIRAKVKDNDFGDWRNADSDIPNILKISGVYNLDRFWSFKGKASILSGLPYSKITGSTYLQNKQLYQPLFNDSDASLINSYRLPAKYTVSIYAQRAFYFNYMKLAVYLDAETNFGHDADFIYNADYSQSVAVSEIPFLGTIGVKGNF